MQANLNLFLRRCLIYLTMFVIAVPTSLLLMTSAPERVQAAEVSRNSGLNHTAALAVKSGISSKQHQSQAQVSVQSSEPSENLDEMLPPSNLQAVAGDQEVRLSWNGSATVDIDGYQILYDIKPGISTASPYSLVVPKSVGTKTISGLTNGQAYYFAVRSYRSDQPRAEYSDLTAEVSAVPKDNEAPVTELVTDPRLPNGHNSWFRTHALVKLSTLEEATTYYQWNGKLKGNWNVYAGPISAPEGENILYYYSIDKAKNVEKVKWAIVKVDTVNPEATNLTAKVEGSNSITIHWNSVADADYYEVWKVGEKSKLLAKVKAGNESFTDKAVICANSYQYKVVTVDKAGNKSKSSAINVWMPACVVSPQSVAGESVVEQVPAQPKTVLPSIRQGTRSGNAPVIAQNGEEKKEQVSPSPTPLASPSPQATPTGASSQSGNNGWGRILIALGILIIAAGAAIGGYYGYEWLSSGRKNKPPKINGPEDRW